MTNQKELTLPTGKGHISFSELKTWIECGWAHKLIHIDKLSDFEDSIYSDFGKAIHTACEGYLQTRKMDTASALSEIKTFWEERGYPDVDNWPEYKSAVPVLQYWLDTAENMLASVPSFMEEQYPGWEVVAVEERFREPFLDTGFYFKGFIDAIIKVEKKGKTKYYIIDWKTAGNGGWHPQKRRDNNVRMQLVLYKYFWAQKHKIDYKSIQCAFVLLKRNNPDMTKKSSGNRCSILKVSAGPVTIERAVKKVKSMFTLVNRRMHLKNRYSCKFCEFFETEHCKLI